jgi:LSD1 subclass zinc finger protein
MKHKTSIEWTHQKGYQGAVWNPTTGCTRVSAGCDNCYAFALHDHRYKVNADAAMAEYRAGRGEIPYKPAGARAAGVAMPWSKQYDLPFSRVQLMEERVEGPLRVRRPTCYFVDSMADLFHEDVPDEFIERVWKTMVLAEEHRFLILTKRPERMRSFVTAWTQREAGEVLALAGQFEHDRSLDLRGDGELVRNLRANAEKPRPNIWLGTSVEDQASADERIPHLIATPAAVRFLSCEPLLAPVDITRFRHQYKDWCPKCRRELERPPGAQAIECAACGTAAALLIPNELDWVIVGGESGPRARPMDLAWARSLVAQCRAAGVTPFMKQLGSKPGYQGDVLAAAPHPDWRHTDRDPKHPGWTLYGLRESHGRDMSEWPEDLRVREFPNG